MATVLRKVIKIDEELCNGCGQCVPSCAEGAIQIIDGKAKLVADKFCDGLGACLGECPMGALSFEEREAEEFDMEAVESHLTTMGRSLDEHNARQAAHGAPAKPAGGCPSGGGCPSARMFDFSDVEDDEDEADAPKLRSALRQWPVKLNLVSPTAPYFQDADLVLAADCTAFAYASMHPDFMKGKALAIGCPKFEDVGAYKEKLKGIILLGGIRSITVLHMEVPCCLGLLFAAQQAVAETGADIPLESIVISIRGEVKEPSVFA